MPDILSITAAAELKIHSVLKDGHSVMRISLKKGGCAGHKYSMDIVEGFTDGAIQVQAGMSRIEIPADQLLSIIGTKIDYVSDPLSNGFLFANPNVTESCGCGASICI